MSKQSGSGTAMNKKRRAKPCRSARKARTRKPKFLSLRLQLAGDKRDGGSRAAELQDSKTTSDGRQQLNLFPLHPENLTEEKDAAAAAAQEDNYVAAAYNFFSAAESGATTLTGLLGAPSTSASSGEDYRTGACGGNKAFSSSDSLYGCRGAALERTALRSKERKPCEEKWVCYSEVVENERKDEEVTSSASNLRRRVSDTRRRLSLKLDYEEIITAWSNRGSLYIQQECPQTVPDIIHDDFFSGGFYEPSSSHGTWGGGWESQRNMSLFTVPEMVGSSGGKCGNDGDKAAQDGGGGGDEEAAKEAAAGQTHRDRAASVLRYKEKRQNRLFSKTIRYQVRKLNAEKRPRVKGRFVKRD